MAASPSRRAWSTLQIKTFRWLEATAPRTIGGYNLVRWTENNKTYWAVSDLNIAELEKFAQLIRTTASVK